MSRLQTILGDLSAALDKDSLRPNETSKLLRILSTAEGDDLEACAELVGTMAEQGRAPGVAQTLCNLAAAEVEEEAVEQVVEEETPTQDPTPTPEPVATTEESSASGTESEGESSDVQG